MRKRIIGLLFIGIALSGAKPAPANDNSGLTIPCSSCHNDMRDKAVVPAISDYSAEEIKKKLMNYRNSKEQVTIMQRIMKGYDEKEITVISELLGKK